MEDLKVQIRGGFSERNNLKSLNTEMQIDDLDGRTRVKIYNFFATFIEEKYREDNGEKATYFYKGLIRNVYCRELQNGIYYNFSHVLNLLKQTMSSADYYDVFDLIEYLIRNLSEESKGFPFAKIINNIFEAEYVGYRIVDNQVVPITNEVEIQAVENALKSSFEHIKKALVFLSDREHPDYENSIKESISAVEATCNEILGENGSLGEMLNRLEKGGIVIHGALKASFSSLYGYTSDASGIRHAGEIGGEKSTFEEAQFMVVACSAFINYLKGCNAKTK